jgi:hypothetical protein
MIRGGGEFGNGFLLGPGIIPLTNHCAGPARRDQPDTPPKQQRMNPYPCSWKKIVKPRGTMPLCGVRLRAGVKTKLISFEILRLKTP